MTRTSPHKIAAVLLVATAFAASPARARALDVETDFDPGTNFAALRSYYWTNVDPSPNDIMNDRIMGAVNYWLTLKGLHQATAAEADVAVSAHVTTQEKQELQTYYDGGYWGWGWGWGWGGPGYATTTVHNYLVGTLTVDLLNAKTKKLIWRGTATDEVSDDPQKNARHIQKAVAKMFEDHYPPGLDDD
jgi:hypothetical protein